jgi:deoxyhypusine synthase
MSSNQPLQPESAAAPSAATNAVLKPSVDMPDDARRIRGVDFNNYQDKDITVQDLVANMANMGFQATALAEAVRIIDEMVRCKASFPARSLLFPYPTFPLPFYSRPDHFI